MVQEITSRIECVVDVRLLARQLGLGTKYKNCFQVLNEWFKLAGMDPRALEKLQHALKRLGKDEIAREVLHFNAT